jgi:ABC-type sugar transport system permease subunit
VRLPVGLILPFLIAVAAFWLLPVADGFLLSLQSDTLYGASHFVGLVHYREVLADPRFHHALWNTALYAVLTTCVVVPLAMGVALLLERSTPAAATAARISQLQPAITPPLVLAMLFVLVFSGRHGLLNALTSTVGLPAVDWIQDPRAIKPALVIQAAWRWTGFVALCLLSALQAIPREYYDVARAEGAGALLSFRLITLPLARRALLFVVIVLVLDAFVLFSGAYVLLGGSGGTSDAGLMLISYAYQTAFRYGRFGTAAAMAYLAVPALMVLLVPLLAAGARRRA